MGGCTNNQDLRITKAPSVDSEIQTDISIPKASTMRDFWGLTDVKEEVSKEECPKCSKEKVSQQVSTTLTPPPDSEPGINEGGSVPSVTRNPPFYRAASAGCFNIYSGCRRVFSKKERSSS